VFTILYYAASGTPEGKVVKKMTERQNTVVCCFDHKSPRITAIQIYELIDATLHLEEEDVRMIQVDRPGRRVYIKFTDNTRMETLIQYTRGRLEFKHENGVISQVTVEIAGMGIKKIRIANLPPEVPDRTLRDILTTCGVVKSITEEQWMKAYRYEVSNGIRIVEMAIRKHLPSTMHIANNRILVPYEGQPATCYGCGGLGHQYQGCPQRRQAMQRHDVTTPTTWTNVVTRHHGSTISNIIQTSHSDPRIEGQGTTGNTQHAMQPQDTRHWPQIQHDIIPVTAEAELTTESAQEITPSHTPRGHEGGNVKHTNRGCRRERCRGNTQTAQTRSAHGEHSDQ
jgi:hypothetical protein